MPEIIPLDTKKIHRESKRGCPCCCDYCEHGAATNKSGIIRISNDRPEEETAFFKMSNIEEINVLETPLF